MKTQLAAVMVLVAITVVVPADQPAKAHITVDDGPYEQCPDDNRTHVHISDNIWDDNCVSAPSPSSVLCKIIDCDPE